MKKTVIDIIHLLRQSAHQFNDNDPIMMAGALAFFTVFAIPPILIIIIFLISLFTGERSAAKQVFDQIDLLIGAAGSGVLQNIVEHYFLQDQNLLQRLFRIGIFVFASSSFFLIIQHALNRIWMVKPKAKKNFLKILENRALSYAIILAMGLLLAASLGTQPLFRAVRDNMNQLSPFITPVVLTILSILFSLFLGTLCFGVIYKFLPDVFIEWKVVWVGAVITSLLFTLGRYIIGFALRNSNVQAMYGTAGAMAIFLLWVFYSSIILFYGAEITQQYARSFAEDIQPKDHAVKIEMKEISPDAQ